MAEFKLNKSMFGMYAKIRRGYGDDIFLYKIIGQFASNNWVDVPLRYPLETTIKDKIMPVANVVECGIAENEVIKIALKDVECILSNDLKTVIATGKDFDYEVHL